MNINVQRLTITAGFMVLPFYLAVIAILGALEPDFSHLNRPMSILGGVAGLRGLIFNLGVAITGLLIIVFGMGLVRRLPSNLAAKIGFVLLLIGGLGLIGAGYFHCNQGCKNIFTEPDIVGKLHIFTSLMGGMGTGLALFFFWVAMRQSERWQNLGTPTLAAAILANFPGILFWLTIATGYRWHSIEGLIQRMGFIVFLIWVFFMAAKLRKLVFD